MKIKTWWNNMFSSGESEIDTTPAPLFSYKRPAVCMEGGKVSVQMDDFLRKNIISKARAWRKRAEDARIELAECDYDSMIRQQNYYEHLQNAYDQMAEDLEGLLK